MALSDIQSIDDIRKKYPSTQGLTDLQIINKMADTTGRNPALIGADLGIDVNELTRQRGPVMGGITSAYDTAKADVQGLGAGLAKKFGMPGVSNTLSNYATRSQTLSQEEGRPDLENITDLGNNSGFDYAKYQVAKGITGLVPYIAGTLAVPEAAVPSALARIGAVAPRVLGGAGLDAGASFAARRAAASAGQGFAKNIVGGAASMEALGAGSQYNQMVNKGEDADIGRAALDAAPSSAIMAVAPGIGKGMLTRGAGFEGGFLARTGKSMATEGGIFAAINTGSTAAEIYNDPNLTAEQKRNAIINSGASGFITGAALGLVGGFHDPHKPQDLLQSDTEEKPQFGGYLPHYAEPTMIVYPDGSTGTAAQAEHHINFNTEQVTDPVTGEHVGWNHTPRTEAERLAVRAQLLGFKPQEAEQHLLGLPAPTSDYEGSTLVVYPDGSTGPRDHVEHFIKHNTDEEGNVFVRPDHEQSFLRGHMAGYIKELNRAEFPADAVKPENMPLQDFIDSQFAGSGKAGKDYQEALNLPSGRFGFEKGTNVDEKLGSQQERPLTQGEVYDAEYGYRPDATADVAPAVDKAQEAAWGLKDPETGEVLPTPEEVGAKFKARRDAYTKVAEAFSKGEISRDDFENLTNTIAQHKRTGELAARVDRELADSRSSKAKLSVSDEAKAAEGYVKVIDAEGKEHWELPAEKANRGTKGAKDAGERTPLDQLGEDTSLVHDYLGLDETGKPDTTKEPMSLQELADAYGFNNKEAVRKRLSKHGYNEKAKNEILGERDLADAGDDFVPDQATEENYTKTLSDEIDKNDLAGDNENSSALTITKTGTIGDTGTGKGWTALLKRHGTEGFAKRSNGEPVWKDDQLQEAIASGKLTPKQLKAAIDEVKNRNPNFVGSENNPTEAWRGEKNMSNRRFEQTLAARRGEYQRWLNSRGAALFSALELGDKVKEVGDAFNALREHANDPHFEDLPPNERAMLGLSYVELQDYPEAYRREVREVLNDYRDDTRDTESTRRTGDGVHTSDAATDGAKTETGQGYTESTEPVRKTSVPSVTTKRKRTYTVDSTETNTASDDSGARKSLGKFDGTSNARNIETRLKKLFQLPDRFKEKVTVFQSEAAAIRAGIKEDLVRGVKGFAVNGKVVLIADNIPKGRELGVFLHEMGVHVGFERLIGRKNMEHLSSKIESWSKLKDGSLEAKIAQAAKARVEEARKSTKDWSADDELHETLAYFVEEAVNHGVDPLADKEIKSAGLREWFRRFIAATKVALRKIGLERFDELTAQDFVDLAYGAADMELGGMWHGTAADFRKFDHSYMGTGEGNQAFGFGSYLAQRLSIGKQYHRQEAKKKQTEGVLLRARSLVGEHELLNWDKPLSEQSPHVQKIINEKLAPYFDAAKANARDDDFLGQHMYHALMDEALNGNKEVLGDVSKDQPKQAASMYLDKLGIKGTKYFDDTTRQNVMDENKLLNEVNDLEDKLNEIKAKYGERETMSIADQAKYRKVLTDIMRAGDQLHMLKERTQNHVIFNDKNLVRMSTLEGADKDRIRFSKVSASEKVVESLPKELQEPVRGAVDAVSSAVKKAFNFTAFTRDVIGRNSANKEANRFIKSIHNQEYISHSLKEKTAPLVAELTNLGEASHKKLWNYVKAVTESGSASKVWKTGKQYDWKPNVEVSPELKRMHDALSAKEQSLAERVFKTNFDRLQEIRDAVKNEIRDIYEERIAKAKPEDADKLRTELEKELKKVDKEHSEIGGYYASMRRDGSHVVVAKSKAYMDAAEAGDISPEMEADPNHKYVRFVDNEVQAKRLERELKQNSSYANVTSGERIHYLRDQQGVSASHLRRIANRIKESADENGHALSEKMQNLINDLYLTSLADSSSRKSELNRKGTAGMTADDMLKSFKNHLDSTAHYIGHISGNTEVADAYRAMADYGKEHGNDAAKIANEVSKRYENTLKYETGTAAKFTNKAMHITSMLNLVLKPAYYLHVASQPIMMSQPYLAAKYKYGSAVSHLGRAYNEVFKNPNMWKAQGLDLNALPADVRNMITALKKEGLVHFTNTQDFGQPGERGVTKAGRLFGRANAVLSQTVQKVEMSNRLVTALASFRLAKEAGKSEAEAIKDTIQAVGDTQGDYSAINAPRITNSNQAFRLATQFRRFQMTQLAYMAKMFKDTVAGESPEVKKVALKQLGFVFAHYGVLAGAIGLPFASTVAFAYQQINEMMGKPADLELDMRKWAGDEFMADLLTHGAPAAMLDVNLTDKIGAGRVASILPPNMNIDTTKRGGYAEILQALAGPTLGGLGQTGYDAIGKITQGDYYGALARISPAIVGETMKAVNEQLHGQTNSRGDVIAKPEDITLWMSTLKALGLKSETESVRKLVSEDAYQFNEFFKTKSKELSNEYVQAFNDGDSERLSEIRDEWKEMMGNQRDLGFKPAQLQTLLSSPAKARKRSDQVIDGVQYNKQNQKFVQRSMSNEGSD